LEKADSSCRQRGLPSIETPNLIYKPLPQFHLTIDESRKRGPLDNASSVAAFHYDTMNAFAPDRCMAIQTCAAWSSDRAN